MIYTVKLIIHARYTYYTFSTTNDVGSRLQLFGKFNFYGAEVH